MALRMLEITVPEDRYDDVCAALEDLEVLDKWKGGRDDGRGFVRVLVTQEGVEAVSDRLLDRFDGGEGFRIAVLAVEAIMPTLEPEEPEESADAQPSTKEKRAALRVSREELYQDLESSTRVSWVYLATVVLSTLVAAVGLLRDDVAVIIGAMVIAPLLGPNVALSLSATLGDGELALRSIRTNLAGLLAALVVAVLVGVLVSVDPTSPQIASRSTLGAPDLVLALAAGSAGTLAYTTGLSGAVIGVMVAVALLPPLVAGGLLLGSGHVAGALEAFTLVVANVTGINLAGVATFLVQRVRPRTWWEEKKARKSTLWAVVSWLGMLLLLGGIIIWKRLA